MHTPGTGHPILCPFSRLERQLLFVPERSFRGTPEHVGLAFEDIFPVTSGGVKLHGWHIPGKSTKVAWLIFHGNGGNISVRLDQYAEINRRYGASVVAIDYRGYGRSEGVPSETGFYGRCACHVRARVRTSPRQANRRVRPIAGRCRGRPAGNRDFARSFGSRGDLLFDPRYDP